MAAAVDQATIVKNINNLINFYDPPKDLHDAPGVTATNHKVELREAMEGLFVGGTFPDPWVAVGKKIGSVKTLDVIKGAIISNPTFDRVFRERELIIRSKHTSGHNPVPDGLCLAQDNGPVDIVSNAKLIITPGSIPDPAGKTKESAKNGLFTVSNIVEATNSLPKSFLDAINMGFILSVDINKVGANYQIIIKTDNIGTITETFDGKTFLPDLKKTPPSFFAGNPKKNTEIGRLIQEYRDNKAKKEDNLKKIRSYLLCKELGDTLQVIWLNYIFILGNKKTSDGTPILRRNTVIGTTDEVVFYRSLVNNVGVIHTIDNGGKTHLYSPTEIRPEDARELIRQQIKLKQKDVIGQNMSVITNLNAILTSTRSDDSWIEKTNWAKLAKDGQTLRKHATNIIEKLLTALNSYNDRLNARFDDLTVTSTIGDIATAKEMAENERFREPFIDCKERYYKIKSIKSIVYNNKIKFDPQKFTEISVESYDTGEVPSFSGGGSMSGGVIKPEILRKIQQQKRITEDDKRTYEMPENIGLILSANVPSEIGLEHLNKCFLYCFIREFMPELFTYAKFMKDGLNKAGVTAPTDNDDYIHILETKKLDYKWKEDNKIDVGEYIENTDTGLADYQEIIPEETKNEFIDIAKNVLKYSHLFVNLFTNFKSLMLEHFFDHVKFHIFNRVPNSFYKIDPIHEGINDDVILEHVLGVQEGGGISEEQLDKAASIAIDSYDLYYESLIKSAYYHPKIESTSVVSKTHVKSPGSKTQRATKAKATGKANTLVTPRTRAYVRNSSGTPQRKSVRKVLFVDQEPISVGGKRRTRRKGKKGSKTRRRA